MDNFSRGDERPLAWATPKLAVVALTAGSAVLAGAAVVTEADAAGRLLIGLAATAALVLAVLAAVQRPRLAVEGDELTVKTVRGVRGYHRTDVYSVRVVPYPRLGRRVPMLEMDVAAPGDDDRLLIFGRWDLGADPRAVFDVLDELGWVADERSER